MYVFYNLPVLSFSQGSIIFLCILGFYFGCLNMSIGNFCIFLLDLSLFACIFMLDF